jgi:hypothetical protein
LSARGAWRREGKKTHAHFFPHALPLHPKPKALAPAAVAASSTSTSGGPRYITARLRPPCAPDGRADPLGHPLFSARRERCAGVVVRVARPADGNAPDRPTSITAVAGVRASHHFPGLADVQYVAWDGRPPTQQAGRMGGAGGAAHSVGPLPGEPLLAVPPSFCRTDVPALAPGALFNGGGGGTAPDWPIPGLAPPVVAAHAAVVPPPAEGGAPGLVAAVVSGGGGGGASASASPSPEPVALVTALLAAYESRPAWAPAALGGALAAALPELGGGTGCLAAAAAAGPALARLTYRFASGPWAGLAVRRGYDPRADPAARAWQAVAVAVGGGSSSENEATVQQLCDLAEDGDAAAAACLAGEPARKCDVGEAGWCAPAAWAALVAARTRRREEEEEEAEGV